MFEIDQRAFNPLLEPVAYVSGDERGTFRAVVFEGGFDVAVGEVAQSDRHLKTVVVSRPERAAYRPKIGDRIAIGGKDHAVTASKPNYDDLQIEVREI